MNMPPIDPPPIHPDPERLAALAGDEPEAIADATLAAHVRACGTCTTTVDEMRALRAALAALPDVAPPRPLRLVPAVPAPKPRDGWAVRLRRLTAPVMALAAVLIVVGAVGSAPSFLATGGAAVPAGASAGSMFYGDRNAAAPSSAPMGAGAGGAVASAGEVQPSAGNEKSQVTPVPQAGRLSLLDSVGEAPYAWILGAGVVLLAFTFLARAWLVRRAA